VSEIPGVSRTKRMRINTTTRYGVRALFDMVHNNRGRPTQIKDISRRQKISERYLEQIFARLLKAGLLKSKRGPRGGYMLARDPAEVSIVDVIEAAQGPIIPVACLAQDGTGDNECPLRPHCVTRHVWRETQRLLVAYFSSVTIADLCAMAAKNGIPSEFGSGYTYSI
jgi:Rrf2 family iron-sulfur cluster assembly transcriptional regulator